MCLDIPRTAIFSKLHFSYIESGDHLEHFSSFAAKEADCFLQIWLINAILSQSPTSATLSQIATCIAQHSPCALAAKKGLQFWDFTMSLSFF